MVQIQIHFSGDIAKNHQVSMRTLGKTLVHLQNSMDRACLEMTNGVLWKYAKMPQRLYKDVEFLVQEPEEGGYVLKFLNSNPVTKTIIDRVASALNSAVQQSMSDGIDNGNTVKESIATRKMQLQNGLIAPESFQSLFNNPDSKIVREYGDRAIVREIDQVLAIIRSKNSGDSNFELSLYGNGSARYDFNRAKAKKFHSIVTKRELGPAIIYNATIRSLDWHNLKGEIVNTVTKKTASLLFLEPKDLQEVIPFFEEKSEMSFLACPLIEYGAFDPMAGDLHYLGLI